MRETMLLNMLKCKIHRAVVTQAELNYVGSITIEAGSGIICLNGAAARMVSAGDKVIIMCYAQMQPEEAADNPPKVVFVDEKNQITSVAEYEKHGRLGAAEKGEGNESD